MAIKEYDIRNITGTTLWYRCVLESPPPGRDAGRTRCGRHGDGSQVSVQREKRAHPSQNGAISPGGEWAARPVSILQLLHASPMSNAGNREANLILPQMCQFVVHSHLPDTMLIEVRFDKVFADDMLAKLNSLLLDYLKRAYIRRHFIRICDINHVSLIS